MFRSCFVCIGLIWHDEYTWGWVRRGCVCVDVHARNINPNLMYTGLFSHIYPVSTGLFLFTYPGLFSHIYPVSTDLFLFTYPGLFSHIYPGYTGLFFLTYPGLFLHICPISMRETSILIACTLVSFDKHYIRLFWQVSFDKHHIRLF